MEKYGNFISLAKVDGSGWGAIFRGFKAENPMTRERALFYQIPLTLKAPDSFPHHIAVLDVLHHEMVQGKYYFGHRYVSGFPLSLVLKRCGRDGFPLPLDHALLIMERVLAAFEEYRPGLPHPFLIWMTYEGEVKCSPLPLSRAFPKWKHNELLPYLSPQLLDGEEWGRAEQVYAAGALFFELLTGKSLPADASEDVRINAVLRTPVMAEGPIPKDLQVILLKALASKVPERYQHVKNMREEMGHLIYSGAYTPTTFNLAFFMHSLFREEVDGEEKLLQQEDAADLAPLFKQPDPPKPIEPPAARPPAPAPSFAASAGREEEKKKTPVVFIAVAAVAILGIVAGIFFFRGKGEEPAPSPAAAQTSPADLKKQKELEDKLQASQKALEELQQTASKQKEEMDRLVKAQKEGQKNPEIQKVIEQKQKEAQALENKLKEAEQAKKNIQEQKAKTVAAAPPASAPAGGPSTAPAAPPGTGGSVPAPAVPSAGSSASPAGTTPAAAAAAAPVPDLEPKVSLPADVKPVAPSVKEGDLVSIAEVDSAPVVIKKVNPVFPPIAKLKKLKGKITLKVLVNEKGRPVDFSVVSSTAPNNVGFEKAAEEAVRQWEFQAATKAGIRVKTWFLVPVVFE